VSFFKQGKDAMQGLRALQEFQKEAMSQLSAPGGFAHMTGAVDHDVLHNGLLGQGLIISVQETGVSVGSEHDPRPVCEWEVQVRLDNTEPYVAYARQSIQLAWLPQFVPGQTMVAVRVDPANHSRVVLDFSHEVPTVTLPAGSGAATAASVLATGVPVRAVVIQSAPLNARNPAGLDMYVMVLTVLQSGQAPRQVKVGNPVPPEGIPLLYPGSNMPAKTLPDQPNVVVIDWEAAVHEASR
jgi:hypothetical protein